SLPAEFWALAWSWPTVGERSPDRAIHARRPATAVNANRFLNAIIESLLAEPSNAELEGLIYAPARLLCRQAPTTRPGFRKAVRSFCAFLSLPEACASAGRSLKTDSEGRGSWCRFSLARHPDRLSPLE